MPSITPIAHPNERSYNRFMSPEIALEKVQKFWNDQRRMPSYAEAANLFKLSSKDSAYRIISKLIKQGFFEQTKTSKKQSSRPNHY